MNHTEHPLQQMNVDVKQTIFALTHSLFLLQGSSGLLSADFTCSVKDQNLVSSVVKNGQ